MLKQLFNALKWNIQSAQMQSRTSTRGIFRFTNPFSSSFEDNELYFLSFGVPAKPGIAKELIETDDIGRKAGADFIDSLLVKKICLSQPIKCYKLIEFWGLRGQARRNCPIYKT